MAKQSVSMVERHVEKVVLGIGAAALLATVALYVVSTPNKIDLSGESVGPDNIDERVRAAGATLRDKLRNVQPPPSEVKDVVPELERALSPLEYAGLSAEMIASVPFLPPVPDIIDVTPVIGALKLATCIAPGKPLVTFARTTVDLQPPAIIGATSSTGGGSGSTGTPPPPSGSSPFRSDINAVTIAALFDQQSQIAVCKAAGYPPTRRNPYLIGVELQRQHQLPNGQFSEWVDIKTYAPLVWGAPPEIDLLRGPKGWVAPEPVIDRMTLFFALLKEAQREILRPLPPLFDKGPGWIYPKFKDVDVTITLLDAELCVAKDNRPCAPRPYPPQWDVVDTSKKTLTAAEEIAAAVEEAEKLLQLLQCLEAKKKAEEILAHTAAKDPDKKKARELLDLANQCEQDKARRPSGGAAEDAKTGPGSSTTDEQIRLSPYQVVWVHDMDKELNQGAASGMTYRYRLRARLYNTYAAIPQDLADPEDAKKVFILGEWSEPSDEVTIPQDTEFYLTHGNPNTNEGAKVTVFTWYEGVWASHNFPVLADQPILDKQRVQVGVRADGQSDRPQVTFDARAVAVDVDYDYTARTTKKKGKGFTVTEPAETIALVYRDSSGELRQRVLATDKGSEGLRSNREREYDPKKTGK